MSDPKKKRRTGGNPAPLMTPSTLQADSSHREDTANTDIGRVPSRDDLHGMEDAALTAWYARWWPVVQPLLRAPGPLPPGIDDLVTATAEARLEIQQRRADRLAGAVLSAVRA